jgi:RNA polymerase sigma factor (sigma-70 family)
MPESHPELPSHERIPEGLAEALYPYIRACRKGRRTCDLHTSDIAHTAVQDLFVFLLRCPRFIKEEDIRRLGFRFAKHVTFDFIRKARRRLLAGQQMPEDADRVDSSARAPGSGSFGSPGGMNQELRTRLAAALDTLDPVDRDIVRMRNENIPWDQVAAATGLQAVTVRKRWQRIRARLQRELRYFA